MKNRNITFKLTVAIVLFAGILLVGLSIPAYLNGTASLRTATLSELDSTSLEKQSALDAWIYNREHTIRDIASNQFLSGMVNSSISSQPDSPERAENTQAVLSILKDWSGEGHNFINLEVIDPNNGQIIISTESDEVGKYRENQPFFTEGLKSAYVQNPYYDLALQRPIMTASAPIISSEGKVIAVLAGRLDLDELNEIILRRTGQHQSDDVFLVNSSHFFVTQPRLIPDPAVLQRGIYTVAVNTCLTQTNGAIEALDYREVPSIIVFRWLPALQLCLVTKIDQQEAYAPIRSLGESLVITGLIVLFLGSIGAILLARSLTKPIHQLAHGTAQISQGNLEHRINNTSGDEIGQLATAFNQMAESIAGKDAQLRNWTGELEKRVEERTSDLHKSEEALRHSYEVMSYIIKFDPDAIAIFDNNLHYIAVSDRYLSDYNIVGQNIIGKHHYEVFPEMPQKWRDVHQRVLAGAIERNDDDDFDRPDGSKTYNRWECRPWFQSDGSIGGMITYTEVTTERKLAEKALRDSEKKYRDLYESMMDAFAIIDMEGRIIEFNNSFRELVGYSTDELYRLTYTNLTPEKWHLKEAKIIADQVLQRGYSDVYEKEYITKGGITIPIEVRTYLIRDEKGENAGMWAIIRNISERKKAEEEIQQLNQTLESKVEERTAQLADANKELESFSYSVSHDLRTPLRALDGFSLAVLEDYGSIMDHNGKHYLNRIREASQKMAQLIDAMLILSRVTKAEMNRSTVNLSELAENIAGELSANEPDRKVTWKIASGMVVSADQILIKSVMENLMNNAWKFTAKQSRSTIEVGKLVQGENDVFYVKDDGAGFDMKFASKMFGPFQRFHSNTEFEGTGIGLATVSRIINKHGGRIWAESEPEKGATFYFTLG